MIPADLGARLRELISLPLPEVRPVTPTKPAPDDSLPPGARFAAQIQEKLPDGTFRALVGGRDIRLSLPQSLAANPGQTLELVATRQTPQALIAQLVGPLAEPTPKPQLSQTGQLVSQFTAGKFGETPPALLKGGAPVLAAPPGPTLGAAQIAPQLARALSSSGVFYEAHQALWLAGRMPLEQLRSEPQARFAQAQPGAPEQQAAPRGLLAQLVFGGAAAPEQAPSTQAAPPASQRPEQAPRDPQTPADTNTDEPVQHDPRTQAAPKHAASTEHQAAARANEPATTARTANSMAASLADTKSTLPNALGPRDIAPVVMQQLDSLVNQQLAWQGVIWPGQSMQWTIDVPEREADGSDDYEATNDWQTTLKLTLPMLGEVEAKLHLTAAGLALRIEAGDRDTVTHLQGGVDALASALDALGIPLTGHAIVTHDEP